LLLTLVSSLLTLVVEGSPLSTLLSVPLTATPPLMGAGGATAQDGHLAWPHATPPPPLLG
jgi:hypothetical protein